MQPSASDAYRAEWAVRFGASVFLAICTLNCAIAFIRLFSRVSAMQKKLDIVDGMDFVFLEKGGCGCLFRLRIFETVFTLRPLSFSACSISAVLASGSIPFMTTC